MDPCEPDRWNRTTAHQEHVSQRHRLSRASLHPIVTLLLLDVRSAYISRQDQVFLEIHNYAMRSCAQAFVKATADRPGCLIRKTP